MKRNILFLIMLILSISPAFAGELSIAPEKPRTGERLSLHYTADDNKLGRDNNLFAFIYTFAENTSTPTANEIRLNKSGNKYSGNFTIPANTVYGIIKIGNGKKFDTQSDNYWDFLVYNGDGKPMPGANLRAGVSFMGNLPENCRRNVNLEKALELVKAETELYPNNIQAQIGYVSLQLDLRKIGKDEFEDRVKNLLNRKDIDSADESTIRSISNSLRVINEPDRADELEANFAEKHPQSDLAEEQALSKLSEASSLEQFTSEVLDFLKKFPYSRNRNKVFAALINGYLQTGDYYGLKKVLSQISNVPSDTYSQLAFIVLQNNEIMADSSAEAKAEEATNLMNVAVTSARQDRMESKPKYLSETEWLALRQANLADILEDQGRIYIYTGKYTAALGVFNESANKFGENVPPELYEDYVKLYMNMNRNQDAFNSAEDAIIHTKSTDTIDSLFKILFDSLKISDNYQHYLDSLNNIARDLRLKNLKEDMMNLQANYSPIETVEGMPMDLKAFKGNVMVIGFWATWCKPCDEMLDAFEFLFDKYKDNQNLVFFPVNIWEKNKNKKNDVKKYIKNSDMKIPLYIDKNDVLPQKLGVMGLPTILFIDKTGKIQFRDYGFTNAKQFAQDAQDKIDLLLKQE